jgi:hypothetical protein
MHNVEIWRKNMIEVEYNNKIIIKKLQDENEELKGSIARMKSQDSYYSFNNEHELLQKNWA